MASDIPRKNRIPVGNTVQIVSAESITILDVPEGKSVDQLIHELKEDSDEMVRSAAASSLGRIKAEKSIEPLIQALNDKHVYVRHGAAWALGELKSEKAISALYPAALADNDKLTRGIAAEALWKIRKISRPLPAKKRHTHRADTIPPGFVNEAKVYIFHRISLQHRKSLRGIAIGVT